VEPAELKHSNHRPLTEALNLSLPLKQLSLH